MLFRSDYEQDLDSDNDIIVTGSLSEKFEERLKNSHNENNDYESFLEKLEKINSKYPFVYVQEFLDDYLGGKSKFYLQKKYGLSFSLEPWRIFNTILGFVGKRVTNTDDAFEENLNTQIWNKKYLRYKLSIDFFQSEIDEQICYNILKGIWFSFLLKYSTLDQKTSIDEFKNFLNEKKDILNILKYSNSLKKIFDI